MTNLYDAPAASIAEEPRAAPEPAWRWLAWTASALCLVPVGFFLQFFVDVRHEATADPVIWSLLLSFSVPWLVTGALLAMRCKMALWPQLLLTLLTISVWVTNTATGNSREVSIALGYTLAILGIVFWLRHRRALL